MKTARIFTNGGSQAVRLPAEFRFPDADEVYIRRDAVTGEVILSEKPARQGWAGFFAVRDQVRLSNNPVAGRPANEPLQPRQSPSED